MQQRFFLQILLLAQHVSGITMPIIRSSQKLTKLFLHFYSTKYRTQQSLYNALELLMMGMVMPETC